MPIHIHTIAVNSSPVSVIGVVEGPSNLIGGNGCPCSGKRSRGRPKKTWRYNIKEDMKLYQLVEQFAQYRNYWMTKVMTSPAYGDVHER